MTPTLPSLDPPYGDRDPRAMAAHIAALPDHIDAALAACAAAPWRPPVAAPTLIAYGGMGGSAIAGELTAALVADTLPVPFLVVRDYAWPACVRSGALAVLSSNSGHTEETLALAAAAEARGVAAMALCSGGALAAHAARLGLPVHTVPAGMPPRAALFHGWVPVSRLPHALGWGPDPEPDWREASALLRRRRSQLGDAVPEAANPAKRLARALHGRRVLVYSGPGMMAAMGVRWRQQLNENAKVLAHSAGVPELDHNEIVGWQGSEPGRGDLAVVALRDREDTPETTLRLDITLEYAARQGAAVHEVVSEGTSRIARLASLAQTADHLSLHLALLGGADPTDITSIDLLKRRLAESRRPG
jgi:glucose/mannose-6-phosphate isomerase